MGSDNGVSLAFDPIRSDSVPLDVVVGRLVLVN